MTAGPQGNVVEREPDASRLLLAGVLVLLALRAVVVGVPNMWAWGLNAPRFLPAAWAWGPWLLCAACLHPGIAPAFDRALGALGAGLRRRWVGVFVFASVLALLVWCLDDRPWFTGDFLIRRGAEATSLSYLR